MTTFLEKFLTVSAPGKTILFGEHAVVYGQTAIATSISLRCSVEVLYDKINYSKQPNLIIELEDIYSQLIFNSIPTAPSPEASVSEIIENAKNLVACDDAIHTPSDKSIDPTTLSTSSIVCTFLFLRCLQLSKLSPSDLSNIRSATFRVHSEIPFGSGLGSSAAFATAVTGSFLTFTGYISPSQIKGDWSPDIKIKTLIASIAGEAEIIAHGKPSGIDTRIATFGGVIAYSKQPGPQSTPVVRQLDLTCNDYLRLLVVDSKTKRSTFKVVKLVSDKRAHDPLHINTIIESIGEISCQAEKCLKQIVKLEMIESEQYPTASNTLSHINELVSLNQIHLVDLGLSNDSLDKIVSLLSEYGIVGKITGAGMGGCVIGFAFNTPVELRSSVLRKMKAENWNCYDLSICVPGIEITHT